MASDLNYFGTFLESWKEPQTKSAAGPNADLGFDAILSVLSKAGEARVTDLVGHEAVGTVGSTVDGLLARLGQMRELHWIEMQGGVVRLTDQGQEIAAKLIAR